MRKIGKGPYMLLVLIVTLAGCSNDAESVSKRWYTQAQVDAGAQVFSKNCAQCHGRKGQSIPNWKQVDAEGNYPAPPLNGTAHTWHHDISILKRTIQSGGIALGGTMPAFADKLDAAEQDAVIAYIQSLWPDDIYEKWAQSFLK